MWLLLDMLYLKCYLPEFVLKVAEARYNKNPDDINERLLWEARSRVSDKDAKNKANIR